MPHLMLFFTLLKAYLSSTLIGDIEVLPESPPVHDLKARSKLWLCLGLKPDGESACRKQDSHWRRVPSNLWRMTTDERCRKCGA